MTHCGAVENDDDDYFEDDDYYGDDGDNADVVTLSEGEILKLLYEATDGANWNENENWLVDNDYCT